MRKFYVLSLVLICAFIIMGCGKKETITYDTTLTGNSDHWDAIYTVLGKETFTENKNKLDYDTNGMGTFELRYIGDPKEFKNIKKVSYSYGGKAAGSSSGSDIKATSDYITQTTFKDTFDAKSTTMVKKDDVIEVTVTWNDQKETFTLKHHGLK